ncbi:MAG: hypothetical protein ACYTEX_26775 [Planctomycetota bacterium]|jgi:hypothetical protein
MAKKIAKPTIAQQMIINKRLRAKYPQMFKVGWGESKSSKADVWGGSKSSKADVPTKKKDGDTIRTKSIMAQLRKAGLSDEAISRLRGRK